MMIRDSPRIDRDDTLEIKVQPHPFKLSGSKDKDLIANTINLMGGIGDQAESKYQESLNTLRKRAREVINSVAIEYRNLSTEQYLDRWSLVQLMVELKHPESLPFLDKILSEPNSAEHQRDIHNSSVAEEVTSELPPLMHFYRMGC